MTDMAFVPAQRNLEALKRPRCEPMRKLLKEAIRQEDDVSVWCNLLACETYFGDGECDATECKDKPCALRIELEEENR